MSWFTFTFNSFTCTKYDQMLLFESKMNLLGEKEEEEDEEKTRQKLFVKLDFTVWLLVKRIRLTRVIIDSN